MKSLLGFARRFLKDEAGLETVEYAIIAGIVVAGTVTTIVIIGKWVQTAFENLQHSVNAS